MELVPTPTAAAKARLRQINELLRRHRNRSAVGKDVLSTLRKPALHVAPGTTDASSEHLALLIPRLRLVHEQRAACEARLEELLAALPVESSDGIAAAYRDVEILRSLPGVGVRISATIIAEASTALAERDYRALRAQAGVAPVTQQSGKSRTVKMRYGCNQRLRYALFHWARIAAQRDPASSVQYTTLRQRGATHGRALRSVADRLLRIFVAMLRGGTLYDPLRCRALRNALEVDETGRKIIEQLSESE